MNKLDAANVHNVIFVCLNEPQPGVFIKIIQINSK